MHGPEAARIKSEIEIWASSLPTDMDWPELPSEIKDRDADVWEALIAVADLAGGNWPDRVRKAAVMLVMAGKEAEPSLGVKLLADLQQVFDDKETMRTADVLEALRAME